MFRVLRSAVTIALCLVGCVLAVIELPFGLLVLVAAAGTVTGLTGELLRRRVGASSSSGRGRYLLAGCLGLVFGEATAGLIVGAGWSGVAAAALVAMTWPAIALLVLDRMLDLLPARSASRSLRGSHSQRMPSGRSLRNWPARLRAMSDGAICYAWVISSQDLLRPLPLAERLAIVLNRAYLLDELERRDPGGFANWTASGLSVDPRRFINSTARADEWGHRRGSDE